VYNLTKIDNETINTMVLAVAAEFEQLDLMRSPVVVKAAWNNRYLHGNFYHSTWVNKAYLQGKRNWGKVRPEKHVLVDGYVEIFMGLANRRISKTFPSRDTAQKQIDTFALEQAPAILAVLAHELQHAEDHQGGKAFRRTDLSGRRLPWAQRPQEIRAEATVSRMFGRPTTQWSNQSYVVPSTLQDVCIDLAVAISDHLMERASITL